MALYQTKGMRDRELKTQYRRGHQELFSNDGGIDNRGITYQWDSMRRKFVPKFELTPHPSRQRKAPPKSAPPKPKKPLYVLPYVLPFQDKGRRPA